MIIPARVYTGQPPATATTVFTVPQIYQDHSVLQFIMKCFTINNPSVTSQTTLSVLLSPAGSSNSYTVFGPYAVQIGGFLVINLTMTLVPGDLIQADQGSGTGIVVMNGYYHV
jgi:hypothetical protein